MKMISKDNAPQLRIGEKVAIIGTVYLGSGTASHLPIDIATVCKVTKAQVVVALSTGRVAFSGSETFRLTEDGSNRHVKSSGYSDRLHNTYLKAFESEEEVEAEDAILKERKAKLDAKKKELEEENAKNSKARREERLRKVNAYWEYAGSDLLAEAGAVEKTCAGKVTVLNYVSAGDSARSTAFFKVWDEVDSFDRFSSEREGRKAHRTLKAEVTGFNSRRQSDGTERLSAFSNSSEKRNVPEERLEQACQDFIRKLIFDIVHRC